jgi:hypothetical protein
VSEDGLGVTGRDVQVLEKRSHDHSITSVTVRPLQASAELLFQGLTAGTPWITIESCKSTGCLGIQCPNSGSTAVLLPGVVILHFPRLLRNALIIPDR